MDFALWTRDLVREVIKRKFGVSYTRQGVGKLLHRLGLSPQRPLVRAYEQDPERVARWKAEEYSAEWLRILARVSASRRSAPRSWASAAASRASSRVSAIARAHSCPSGSASEIARRSRSRCAPHQACTAGRWV